VDALVFAEIDDLLLGQQRVVFDLVDGGRDGCFCEELLHVLDRVVCDANGLYLVGMGLDEFLHVEPCLHVRVLVVDVAGAVLELGEERVVSWALSIYKAWNLGMVQHTIGVHGNRPVNQIEIDIWRLQHVQTLLQTLFCARVECAPQLAGDEELLALHDATRDDVLERFAHFILVLVAESTVNMSVP
jgi:hypothetical protein